MKLSKILNYQLHEKIIRSINFLIYELKQFVFINAILKVDFRQDFIMVNTDFSNKLLPSYNCRTHDKRDGVCCEGVESQTADSVTVLYGIFIGEASSSAPETITVFTNTV